MASSRQLVIHSEIHWNQWARLRIIKIILFCQWTPAQILREFFWCEDNLYMSCYYFAERANYRLFRHLKEIAAFRKGDWPSMISLRKREIVAYCIVTGLNRLVNSLPQFFLYSLERNKDFTQVHFVELIITNFLTLKISNNEFYDHQRGVINISLCVKVRELWHSLVDMSSNVSPLFKGFIPKYGPVEFYEEENHFCHIRSLRVFNIISGKDTNECVVSYL